MADNLVKIIYLKKNYMDIRFLIRFIKENVHVKKCLKFQRTPIACTHIN